jgi:germination protein M
MKRFLALLICIQILLLTGCAVPFMGNAGQAASDTDNATDRSTTTAYKNNEIDAYLDKDVVENSTNGNAEQASDTMNQTPDTSTDKTQTGEGGSSETVHQNSEQSSIDVDLFPPSSSVSIPALKTSSVENKRSVTVYYQDQDGYLIPMTRWIPMQQGIARACVSLCIDSASTREEVAYYGVYPVLPEGTEILGIDIRDGTAVIDFSREILDYDSAKAERNIVTAIVYMLTEFRTVSRVKILVNGYSLDKLKYGTDISGNLEREKLAINTDAVSISQTGKQDIYLLKNVNDSFAYVIPVSTAVPQTDDEQPEKLIEKLLEVKNDESLYSELPDGTKLIGCEIRNENAILNFNKSFINYGGTTREEGIINQLAYTLRQVHGINSIMLLVEGEQTELPEGTDISDGIEIPATINDIIDR